MRRLTMRRTCVTRRQFLEKTARGAGAATLAMTGFGAVATRAQQRKTATRKKATRKKARRKKGGGGTGPPQVPEGVVSFFDEAEYTAAAGEEFVFLDFDPEPVEPVAVNGDSFSSEIVFSSPEAFDPSQVIHSGGGGNGAITDAGSTTAANGVGPIAGAFTTPVLAFGFELLSTEGTSTTLLLFDERGGEIDAIRGPLGDSFFGIVSDVAVASWELVNGILGTGNPDRYFIDNFRSD